MIEALLPAAIFGERIAERPADTLADCAAAYEARLAAGGDHREAASAFVERLRDDLHGPVIHGPASDHKRERIARKHARMLDNALNFVLQKRAA